MATLMTPWAMPLLLTTESGALPRWLLELLGVDPERLQGGTEHFRLARLPEGAWLLLAVLLALAAVAVVVLVYRREGQLAGGWKLTLAALRSLLIAGAALVLLYPVLEVDRIEEVRATTIVLADDSLSQSLRDRYLGDPERLAAAARALEMETDEVIQAPRAELVRRVLEDEDARFLERLAARNRLAAYTFSELPLRPLPITRREEAPPARGAGGEAGAGSAAPAGGGAAPAGGEGGEARAAPPSPFAPPLAVEIAPRGAVTDLAGALRLAVEAQGGARVAGIVLLTDGRATAGEDLTTVGRFLRELEVPVHALGVGDPSPSRNLRVAALLASERVFTGDPVIITVRIEETGFDGETVRLELLDAYEPPGEAARDAASIETAELTFGAGGVEPSAAADAPPGEAPGEEGGAGGRDDGTAPEEGGAMRTLVHTFRFEPKEIGRHRLSVRIEARPDEATPEDNERSAMVEVVKEASRVLLVAGGPSYEYRFLTNLLRRDSRIALAAWLMSADPDYPQEGDVSLAKLPDTAKDLFAYDVVCLVDVAPAGLPAGFPALVEEFVSKHRGGLLCVAGSKWSRALFERAEMEPVKRMLPVTADPLALGDELGRLRFHEREWPLEPTAAALDHAATLLSRQIDRNRELWGEIAGFYWSFPARKAKAGATVLFVHPDPALAREGEARPLIATQIYGGGRVFYSGIDATWRWRATAEEVYDRFWIQTIRYLTESRLMGDRRRFLETDRESYDLGSAVRVAAHLEDESREPLEIDAATAVVEAPDGTIEELRLEKDAAAPGWYRGVHVPRLLGVHKLRLEGAGERVFSVAPPALEFQEPELDEAALKALAEATGGSYAPLAGFASLPERVSDRRQTLVATDEPIPLWDNGLVAGILALLLTAEWVLRKVCRLL
jgi:hypothetical protein